MPQTKCLVWGNNHQNLLSSTPNQCLTRPQQIVFPYQVLKMTATEKHVSFITVEGDVYSYGANTDGRLGVGAKDGFGCHYRNAVKVQLEGKAKEIKAGFSHTIVQMENNQIYSWGLGEYGSLGVGQFRSKSTPTRVLVPPTIRSISCGAMHTAFIDFDGNIYMCGSNEYGELGVKSPDKIGTPILVPFGARVKEVACGVFYTLVLTEEGDVFGMGNNKYAQLGLGHKISESKPVLIHELTNIVKVQAGYHSGALNSMCELYLWGCGSFGELLRPKKILLNCPLSNLQIRGFFGVAISESQNRVFIWGNNTHGELGNGGYISYKVPTQMKQLSTKKITKICCGVNFAIAIINEETKRVGYHDSYRVGESRRMAGYNYGRDELSTGRKQHGQNQLISTGRKRLDYREPTRQIHSQRHQVESVRHQNLSQRTRPLHGYNTHSLSPHTRTKPNYQQPINPSSPPQQRQTVIRRQQTSATRSIHFPNTHQTERPKDTSRSYSPHYQQRNYEDLFLNLSRDYEALAKRYKELEGQIEERELLRRSRDLRAVERSQVDDGQAVKELQLINEALKQQAWMMEKEVIICKEELAVALQKISRLEKQIEHLSVQNIELLKGANTPNSPAKSPIKKFDTSRNDQLLRLLGEKQQKLRRLQQQRDSLSRKLKQSQSTIVNQKPTATNQQLELNLKKLQQQNRQLSQQLKQQQHYSTQLQAKYKQLSLKKQRDNSPNKHRSVSPIKSLNEVDLKVIEQLKKIIIEKQQTFDKILTQKQTVILKLQKEKSQLNDKIDEEKIYSAEVQSKYRSVIDGIQQTKIQNINLRQTLLKSQDRISDIQTGMRKMVSDKQYQSAQTQLVEIKSKAKQLEEKLTKTQFTLKSKAQAVLALQQERLKLYNMLEDMKNIEKENQIIADKRLDEQKQKTANTEQKVKQLQVQIKYEKDYSKKVQLKSQQIDKLREDTVNELNRVTETLDKEKKRRKQLQRQVEGFRTTQNELKITRQQLQKQRELNEDYKDKVLKQYKKKDQLIKEMQQDIEEKQAELMELADRKQSDINRLKEQIRKLQQKLQAEKQQVKKLNKEISNKNDNIENLSDEIQKLQRKVKHTKEQIEKQVKERQELVEEVGGLKREQSKLVMQNQESQKRILQLEKDITEVQNSLRRQKTSKTQVQNELQQLQSRMNALKQQNSYMRTQLTHANEAVEQANKVSQQLSNANKEFAENEQALNKKVQELEAKVYELEDENRSYAPRYDALIERNKELDERNKQLSDMVNKAIEIQAQSYKQHILKEVQVSTNQIINDVEDQKSYKQRFNRPQPASQSPSEPSHLADQSFTHPHHQTLSRVKQQPYTKYMNEKIQTHRRRVSESAQKLAGILDLESGIGAAYSKRTQRRVNNDENYEKINNHMEELKSQKEAFMSKINSFAEKMKLL